MVTDVHLRSRFLITFLDTFLHLFNITTGTILSPQYSIFMHSIEFNSTPFHSARIFKLGFICV